ncbi:MAG TPA: hypothetical protein VGZ47_19955, partial [Gemmataceae bacterium]|nr:hypothetical protein [Gemmataceae bacterium]
EQSPPDDSSQQQIPLEWWQALEARWRSVLGMEAAIENLRSQMDGLRAQLEAAFRHQLNVEEKVNALQSDMAQWNKAKNRIHYALPKVREFIHRATWALGLPERKKLEELFKNYIEPRNPFPELDKVSEQLDYLFKERQILSGQGATVHQECVSISSDIQRTLSALQRNARDRARKKMDSTKTKGKYL